MSPEVAVSKIYLLFESDSDKLLSISEMNLSISNPLGSNFHNLSQPFLLKTVSSIADYFSCAYGGGVGSGIVE